MTNPDIITWIDNAIASPSRENFCFTFALVLQHLQLTDLEVAQALEISRPTVGRWVRGEAAPHPVVFVPILNWLRKKIEVACHP
jgi:predicted DNA-binding transcriptional regulator AlpA